MTIRSILVGASGGAASNGALDLGCRLAKRFGARIEAFHVGIASEQLMLSPEPFAKALVGQVTAAAATVEEKTKIAFAEISTRHGLQPGGEAPAGSGAWWLSAAGDAPRLLAMHARFFDLAVLGRSRRVVDEPHTDAVEETLLLSGRPVLLAPEQPPETIGEAIAFAWNGSAQAVRALVASLPLLENARGVFIIMIGEGTDRGVDLLKQYLELHKITAEFRDVFRVEGADLGGQLLSAARDAGADLLVMGGYGRSPWREFLFGGTTREVTGASLLPLFLAH